MVSSLKLGSQPYAMPRERLVPSDNEIVPDPLGQTDRELPKIRPELAMLEYAPVGDRLA
jgi:hypothetical protein